MHKIVQFLLLKPFKSQKENINFSSNKNTENIPANTGQYGIVSKEGLARELG